MSSHNTQHNNRYRKNKLEEEELKETYKELKLLDELKSNIISNVSHELRTPITIAKTALELMKDEKDSEVKNLLLEKAIDALNRQNYIIEDLIQTARLVRGRSRLKLAAVDLGQLITFTGNELKPLITKKGINMEIRIEENLPKVRADKKRLTHIIQNLISNAVKFTEAGGSIVAQAVKKEEIVEVSVCDTGIGIPKEALSKIFDRFYQLNSTEVRPYGGTGMGLAIVKDIVEAHGGRVTVESDEGRGSRFCFTIPITKEK